MDKSKFGYCMAIASLLICLSCNNNVQTQQVEVINVRALEVENLSNASGCSYVGVVNSGVQSELSFQVAGIVKNVFVSQGQKVVKGQILAELEYENLESSNVSAQAALKQAQDGYRRLKALYDNGSLPEVKFIEIKTQLEQAQSMADISAKNLKDAKLYAPYDGVITSKRIEYGESVIPAVSKFTLSKLHPLEVKVSIPENEISGIEKGPICTVNIPASKNKILTGYVNEKNVVAHKLSHTYEVKVRFETEPNDVMPGMICDVDIPSAEKQSSITLPSNTVQIDADGNRFVWCVKNDIATRRQITVGKLLPLGVEITSGLDKTDVVITDGSHKVYDGVKVNIL
ncbi:efflux RND transporter periplasmic adaptor subunit [Marinilabiliaceae bacterium JC017]|nr:efflux RND transporter periplasmic adaptor subunit [Marinilabiliaceae bacterium JC017]